MRYLAAAGLGRVTVVAGDGTLGVPRLCPYQAIVVSAASPPVPASLVKQLASGPLVHPVGPGGPEGQRRPCFLTAVQVTGRASQR
jgi:protein-L-isoaspartate(D-aspartate) O-methyltransferase